MYLEEVEQLARYLMSPGLTIPDVCKFLVLETFSKLKTSAVLASEITEDGCIAPVGVFGLPKKVVEDWGNLPLTLDAPLTDAVKKDQLILLLREEALEKYPILISYDGIPAKWDSYLVCPVLPYGVIALTLNSVPTVTREFEKFIRAAGSLAAFYFKVAEFRVEHFNRKPPATRARRRGVLTNRQLLIKALMEKGYSNPAIAAEIGYSESLVRQETMAIYATLNISGRKDLLEGKTE
jgi:DNA-binding CsgD family transcriptional regulator